MQFVRDTPLPGPAAFLTQIGVPLVQEALRLAEEIPAALDAANDHYRFIMEARAPRSPALSVSCTRVGLDRDAT